MRTQCQVQDSADLVSSEVGSLGSSRMGQFSVMREERGGFERRGEIAAHYTGRAGGHLPSTAQRLLDNIYYLTLQTDMLVLLHHILVFKFSCLDSF